MNDQAVGRYIGASGGGRRTLYYRAPELSAARSGHRPTSLVKVVGGKVLAAAILKYFKFLKVKFVLADF